MILYAILASLWSFYLTAHIRYARTCSSYECLILRAVRLSSKILGQGYVRERLKSSLRKFMVDMGISSNMKSPSPKCYMTFWDMTIYTVAPSIYQTFHHFVNLLPDWTSYRLWPYNQISGGFQRVRPTEDACSSRHLVLSNLGLAFVHMLRPFSHELVMSLDFEFPTSLSTSILLYNVCYIRNVVFLWWKGSKNNKQYCNSCNKTRYYVLVTTLYGHPFSMKVSWDHMY